MAKAIKNLKVQEIKEKITSTHSIFFFGTIFIVFLVYSLSLFRPWLPFDERLIYQETLFPIPKRLSEISEIIQNFAVNYHIESMNSFFSNQMTIRSNPVAIIIWIIFSFFFQKSSFLYHLFQTTIHLINTAIVWIILYRGFRYLKEGQAQGLPLQPLQNYFVISLFTLIWALHSSNTEAVLLTTNLTALLTYTICLLFLSNVFSRIEKNNFLVTKSYVIAFSILFCLTMFLTEYGYTLPFIIFFIILSFAYKNFQSVSKAFYTSLKISSPYFIGLVLFILFSTLRSTSPLINIFGNQTSIDVSSVYIFLERNLWLTPQIFVHLMKLLFFPKVLSLYQSNLTPLANTLTEPYSLLCTSLYLFFFISPLAFFLVFKKKSFAFIFPLIYAFYFSLFPFLHIVTPTYCLSADRYCYFPMAMMILLFVVIGQAQGLPLREKKITIILSIILLAFTTRTLIRIQEWNNPELLYKSAIKAEKNPLYKGQRLIIFAGYIGSLGNQKQMEDSLQESLRYLNKALKFYKVQQKKFPKQPITLQLYGLDNNSLLLKTAYAIATIKNDNYQEDAKEILAFFEPYLKGKLQLASVNQLVLYSEILLRAGEKNQAKEILEYAHKKFPYSSDVLYHLADYYSTHENNSEKLLPVLKSAYGLFPNQTRSLYNLLKYYEQKNDLENQAKFSYLIGLRTHSSKAYQKAVQIYLELNKLELVNKTLKKLVRLKSDDPHTLLLVSRYLDVTGRRSQIPGILNSAYLVSKAQGGRQNYHVTKNILASLININLKAQNVNNAKIFLGEYEKIPKLTQEDLKLIFQFKKQIQELK